MLRVAFLTSTDPLDRGSWSGTPYHMFRALESRGCEVTAIGPLRTPVRNWLRVYGKLRGAVRPGKYIHGHSAVFARSCARAAGARMAGRTFDAAVAPAASAVIAYLKTDVPIVYVSDATFALLEGYYPDFSDLCAASSRDGHALEALAIANAAAVSYPSAWAARSAERDYGAPGGKLHVMPFGVNFENVPGREEVLSRPRSERIELLLVGKQWERKGGDTAVETLLELERMGVDAALTVCGCAPPPGTRHPRLRVVPFLDKNDPHERAELVRLYSTADVLILPTRSECLGMVVAEANAFGLPAFVSATGGLPEVVRDGVNGYALPVEARGGEYARLLRDVWSGGERIRALSEASRNEYETRLNWDSWAGSMCGLFSELSDARSLRPS
ncbi:MAG: glycosyltransferase family 4 protein [Candidatus Eisenbacteria bacterium]